MKTGQGRGGARNKASFLNFRHDPRGAAATEFALILPFALVLLTGALTYGDAIAIDRKVTLTTRTVTDLVTQYSSLSQADLQTLINASSAIIAPYSASNVVVTVSEVTTDAAGKPTIAWSGATSNGTKRPIGQVVSLPAAIDAPNVTYIWGEVVYLFTPTIGYQVTGPMTLHDQTYMSPRLSTAVTLTP